MMDDTPEDRAAADWLARRDRDDWSEEDEAALESWLDKSTAHRVAYLRLARVWSQADRLGALGRAAFARPSVRRRWPRRAIRRVAALGLSAAVAAIVALTMPSTISTGVAERRSIELADGSALELGPLSEVRYRIGAERRTVWIDRGEVYFDVRHDPLRPFIVTAGDRRIVDIGTRFSVRRAADRVSVAVAQGRVEISAPDTEALGGASVAVDQGGIADMRGTAPLRVTHDPTAVADRLSWRDGMLAFDATPLGEVAAEFNRYNHRQLVIAGPSAAGIRIGGRFKADHVEQFAALLHDAYGLKVTGTDGNQITVAE